jgi:hypothetical protein
MTESEESSALDIPVQNLDAPHFCAADSRLLAQWVEQLPPGNPGDSSRQLFNALQELNSTRLDPRLRFELLEVLRPHVYSVCDSLAAHFHNQPLVLPARAFEIYLLTQTMRMQLAVGYQIVAHDAATAKRGLLSSKQKTHALIAQALHRALSDLGFTLFSGYLVYAAAEPNLWRQLHTVYRFACQHGVADRQFKDIQTGQAEPISVVQSYIKSLLLGSVRSNQLRQADLRLVYAHLAKWVGLAELGEFENVDEDFIVVNMDSADPPIFQALFLEPAQTRHCRVLLIEPLLNHISGLMGNAAASDLSADLVKHLLISWSSYTRRTFMRMDSQDSLQVCIGMSNLHFFSANEVEFDDFTRGKTHHTFALDGEKNPFLKQQATLKREDRDLWNMPFRPEPGMANMAVESIDNHIRKFENQAKNTGRQRSYDNYQVEMLNVSAGGYALQWPTEIKASIANGDIMGIRETLHAKWSVGIVSWIRRDGEAIAQLGVKLLGPAAIPYAARVINRSKGASPESQEDFGRVLLLPEIKLIGQPATLLTSKLPFREKQTLQLVQAGRPLTVRLKKLICATGTVNQFDIEILEKPWQEKYEPGTRAERFEALWNSL